MKLLARLFTPVGSVSRGPSLRGGVLMALVWLLWPLVAVGAENYSIKLRVMSGGGGVSKGATYSVGGTVGEPGAGPVMIGPKTYTVVSGYWAVLTAIQRVTATTTMTATVSSEPVVNQLAASVPPRDLAAPDIERHADGLVISWPVGAASGAFTLETTTDVTAPVHWTAVGEGMVPSDGLNRILVPLTEAQQFFRLRPVAADVRK